MSFDISDVLAGKLASIAVHADEIVEHGNASTIQLIQLKALIDSKEVQDFLVEVGPLAPVRRPA